MNFDAIQLEAVYQLLRVRGYGGTRRAFLTFGRKVVAGMRKRGEL